VAIGVSDTVANALANSGKTDKTPAESSAGFSFISAIIDNVAKGFQLVLKTFSVYIASMFLT
jgi:hypothetical protein